MQNKDILGMILKDYEKDCLEKSKGKWIPSTKPLLLQEYVNHRKCCDSWVHSIADGKREGHSYNFSVKTMRKIWGGMYDVYYPVMNIEFALDVSNKEIFRMRYRFSQDDIILKDVTIDSQHEEFSDYMDAFLNNCKPLFSARVRDLLKQPVEVRSQLAQKTDITPNSSIGECTRILNMSDSSRHVLG
ncbi:MAG: hypothetical protein FWE47_02835 [Oscillospiraceae bacterium]|nr:hypothetical protein [Oscillospiraceae bacterium]